MEKYVNPAIVVGGGSVTGLGAVRSLGRSSVKVSYIESGKTITAHSKYCKKYFISSDVSHKKEALKDILLKIQRRMDCSAVIFPASDLYSLYLSDLVDELKGSYVVVPSRKVIEILINKRIFYQSLSKEKVPMPPTHFPNDLKDVIKIGKEESYPIFIKPCLSHVFAQHFGGGRKGFVANSQEELVRYCELLMKKGIEVMIQEIVTGSRTNHVFLDGYLDKNQNPKVLFARQRLRMWPLSFGNSSLCKSIPVSRVASLKEPLFRYLKSINYHGIFSAEFKKGERDSLFKLLEINSRTSGWFSTLSAKCGCNIMLTAYLDAIGRDTEYRENYEAGIKWIFLRDDLRSSIEMFLNGDLSMQEWLSSLAGKKDCTSYASDDPMPFIHDVLHEIKDVGRYFRSRSTQTKSGSSGNRA